MLRSYDKNIVSGNYSDMIQNICEICKDTEPADRVILFGSVARDDYETGKSDIDIYIESESMTTSKLEKSKNIDAFESVLFQKLYEIGEELGSFIACDIVMFGKERLNGLRESTFWKNIESEGIVLYDLTAKKV